MKKRELETLARKVHRLAINMENVGRHMVIRGRSGEIGAHGKELLGAAKIAKSWVEDMCNYYEVR